MSKLYVKKVGTMDCGDSEVKHVSKNPGMDQGAYK